MESEYLKFAEVKLRRVAAAFAVNFEGVAGQFNQVFVGRTHVEGQDAPLVAHECSHPIALPSVCDHKGLLKRRQTNADGTQRSEHIDETLVLGFIQGRRRERG